MLRCSGIPEFSEVDVLSVASNRIRGLVCFAFPSVGHDVESNTMSLMGFTPNTEVCIAPARKQIARIDFIVNYSIDKGANIVAPRATTKL